MTIKTRSRAGVSRLESVGWARIATLAIVVVASIHKVVIDQYQNQKIYLLAAHDIWAGAPIYSAANRVYDVSRPAFDIFTYSPAFALWYSAFLPLPRVMVPVVWNLLSAILLLASSAAFIRAFKLPRRVETIALFLAMPALVLSVQHFQTNVFLLAAAMLAIAWAADSTAKYRKVFPFAAMLLALGATAKPYILFVAPLTVAISPHFRRERAAILAATLLWAFGLPFIALDGHYAVDLYRHWGAQMLAQNGQQSGESVMALVDLLVGRTIPNFGIQLTWLTLTAVSGLILVRRGYLERPGSPGWMKQARWHFYALMIGVVIFNHKSESPTLVIAVLPAAFLLVEAWINRAPKKMWRPILGALAIYQYAVLFLVDGRLKEILETSGLRVVPLFCAWVALCLAEWRRRPTLESGVLGRIQGPGARFSRPPASSP